MAPANNLRKRRSPPPAPESASKKQKIAIGPELALRSRRRASSPMVIVNSKVTFDDDEIPFSTAQTSVPSSQVERAPVEKPLAIQDSEREEEEDSDDDAAPEAISAVQAKAQSKFEASKAADAVKAEKQRQAERRRKAQETREEQAAEAARIKEQAAAEQAELVAQEEDEVQDDADTDAILRLDATNPGSLPLLLPASLLETEAPIRPPTPSLSPEPDNGRITKSLSFKDPTAVKRIPDRQAGPVSVRVLEKQNPRLAPAKRMAGISNHRERLLQGREVQKSKMGKARRGPLGNMRRTGLMKAPAFV